jgi:hypothetical protein
MDKVAGTKTIVKIPKQTIEGNDTIEWHCLETWK